MDKNIRTVLKFEDVEENEIFTTMIEARYFLKKRALETFENLLSEFTQESDFESMKSFLEQHDITLDIVQDTH